MLEISGHIFRWRCQESLKQRCSVLRKRNVTPSYEFTTVKNCFSAPCTYRRVLRSPYLTTRRAKYKKDEAQPQQDRRKCAKKNRRGDTVSGRPPDVWDSAWNFGLELHDPTNEKILWQKCSASGLKYLAKKGYWVSEMRELCPSWWALCTWGEGLLLAALSQGAIVIAAECDTVHKLKFFEFNSTNYSKLSGHYKELLTKRKYE